MTLTPQEYEEIIRYIDCVKGMTPLMFGDICKKLIDYAHVTKIEK